MAGQMTVEGEIEFAQVVEAFLSLFQVKELDADRFFATEEDCEKVLDLFVKAEGVFLADGGMEGMSSVGAFLVGYVLGKDAASE